MATADEIKIRIIAKDEASKVFRTASQNSDRLKSSLNGLKVALAAGGVASGVFLKSVIDTGSQVQQLRIRLNVLTGSVKDGATAFQVMSKYASAVPFALEDIQQASAPLLVVSNNVEELGGLLKITGDIASASGLTFQESALQIQRAFSAGINSADLFKERGTAALLGFQQGVNYTAAETRKIIVDQWTDGTGRVVDATNQMAGTFASEASMMQDAWFQLKLQIADTGVIDVAAESVRKLTETLKDPQVVEGVQIFSNALLDLFQFVTTHAKELTLVGATWLGFSAGKQLGGNIGGALGALTAFLATWSYLEEAQASGVESINATSSAIDNQSDVLKKLSATTKNAAKEVDALKGKFELQAISMKEVEYRGLRSLEDGLVDFTMRTKSAKEAFTDMALSIIRDLVRMYIRAKIMNLVGQFTGMNFFGTGATATAPYQSTQQSFPARMPPNIQGIPTAQGGGFTGFGARAGGVDGRGGFPAILHPNETVIDHTKGQSIGGDVNVTLNISTGVSQTVRAEIANLLPQITQATKAAVADARMRGGSFSKSMVGA